MLFLGTPQSPAPWLAWCAFVPLALLGRTLSASRALGAGTAAGTCFALLAFAWFPATLRRFTGLPEPALYFAHGLHSLFIALPYGVWCASVARGPRRGPRAVLEPAASWAVLSAFWPTLFPYTPVAGLSSVPAFIQAAELAGVPLVEALVVTHCVVAADGLRALVRGEPRTALKRAGLSASIVLAATLGGSLRMATLRAQDTGVELRVGLVQPNTPPGHERPAEEMERLHAASRDAAKRGAELIVWPEAGAYPFTLRRPLRTDARGLRRVQLPDRVPTIFGATTFDRAGRLYNSALLLDRAGRVAGLFDKVKLLPGAEFLPSALGTRIGARFPNLTQSTPGTEPSIFALASGLRVAPLICYEELFESFVRRVTDQKGGVDALVSLSNDGWFADPGAAQAHLALAQFRAVEQRLSLLRSVTSGPSASIAATGEVIAALPARVPDAAHPLAPEALVVTVRAGRSSAQAKTLHSRGGWLMPWACALVLLPCAISTHLRGRKKAACSAATLSKRRVPCPISS